MANAKLETLQQELSQTSEVPMTLEPWWPAQSRRHHEWLVTMAGIG